ncbi:hypothetical protein P3T23_009498, partial [Paraburkholderia sp. GAS448]
AAACLAMMQHDKIRGASDSYVPAPSSYPQRCPPQLWISPARSAGFALQGRFAPRKSQRSCGATGALSQLFECYPTLGGWLPLQVWQRRITLEQIYADGRLRTQLRGLQLVHDEFLRR